MAMTYGFDMLIPNDNAIYCFDMAPVWIPYGNGNGFDMWIPYGNDIYGLDMAPMWIPYGNNICHVYIWF